jgi:hypothetical protein
VGRRDSTDGSSTSALKFGSDEPLSTIRGRQWLLEIHPD